MSVRSVQGLTAQKPEAKHGYATGTGTGTSIGTTRNWRRERTVANTRALSEALK